MPQDLTLFLILKFNEDNNIKSHKDDWRRSLLFTHNGQIIKLICFRIML